MALLSFVRPIHAQTESLGRQPYDLHLVVLLGDHRFLATEVFQDQFPRDLVRQTKLALGSLVRVDAATSHPLADAIRREGLTAALDSLDEVSARRTWYFIVRFHDGQFHLQGRFYDGLTGQPGPPPRTVSTPDRGRLAHLAARMIADGFPLVGTISQTKGDSVELTLHGGQLDDVVPLPHGAVFSVSKIGLEAGKPKATRLPWAVVEAMPPPRAGVVAGQFWHRFQESKIVRGEGVVYRALLMPTRTAPLRVQVIDQETSQPLVGIGVKVSGGLARDADLVTDASGLATTPGPVAHLAIVKLSQGGKAFAQFPTPIVDDRPIVVAVSTAPAAEDLAGLERRRQQLHVRTLKTLQLVDQRLSEQAILVQQSLEKTLDHVRKTLAFLDREIPDVRNERDEIKAALPRNAKSDDDGERMLKALEQRRDVVKNSVTRLEQLIVDRDRRTDRHNQGMKFVEQAALYESQARFDDAIAAYKKAVELLPEPGKVAEKLKELETAWAIKSKDHEQARKFLVKTWPAVDAAMIPQHLVLAAKSLETCRDVGDRLTPQCFLKANVDHLEKIAKIVTALKRAPTADDRKKLQSWTDTIATLRRLSDQARDQIAARKDAP